MTENFITISCQRHTVWSSNSWLKSKSLLSLFTLHKLVNVLVRTPRQTMGVMRPGVTESVYI